MIIMSYPADAVFIKLYENLCCLNRKIGVVLKKYLGVVFCFSFEEYFPPLPVSILKFVKGVLNAIHWIFNKESTTAKILLSQKCSEPTV